LTKRTPEIAFSCPACGGEAVCGPSGVGRCLGCAATPQLVLDAALAAGSGVERCPACSGVQLYVQRDFNQRAGLAIVVLGGVLAPFTPFYSSLFVAAAIDALLYLLLPEIVVCYRCQAHFRGFARNPRLEPFDLHVAEQYQERKA
jgi:hypothetical protein